MEVRSVGFGVEQDGLGIMALARGTLARCLTSQRFIFLSFKMEIITVCVHAQLLSHV